MKKVLVLFGILAIAPLASFAFMNESESATVDALRAQGYSESALKTLDLVNSLNKSENINNTYVRQFQPKQTKKIGRGYTALKRYWDPIQEDEQFGVHQVEYTNTWNGDMPHYATDRANTKRRVERL